MGKIIAFANQKGGVGKTTTLAKLAFRYAYGDKRYKTGISSPHYLEILRRLCLWLPVITSLLLHIYLLPAKRSPLTGETLITVLFL